MISLDSTTYTAVFGETWSTDFGAASAGDFALSARTAPCILVLPAPEQAGGGALGAIVRVLVSDSTFGVSVAATSGSATPKPCVVPLGSTTPAPSATVQLTAPGASVPQQYFISCQTLPGGDAGWVVSQ